jgi:hypothetical protein
MTAPILSGNDARADEVATRFAAELQQGLTARDTEVYDGSFAADVLWGSPYGETVHSLPDLLRIHRTLMSAGTAPPSRFEVVASRAPAPGVVVTQIRRQALEAGGFSEVAMYTLVERDGRWWLAAAQNTPVAAKRHRP